MLSEEGRHTQQHIVWFFIHKIQKQDKLMYDVKSQNNGHSWRDQGKETQGGFQGTSNTLLLNLVMCA